ncbi:MAG: hypothetical protein GF418_17245 [Chitinivibrionales bacterium]|nr:hypothetical protein [Chitinivibrionales bacterium]MBD3397366.1 hypothetical protein [Chitinivibrionales bacterium]
MDVQRLKELVDNPDFITGIYNYCDRWCERCPFTGRCATYALEKVEDGDDPEANDIENQRFWDKMHDTFRLTFELIKETADEQGIDLNDLPQESPDEKAERERRKRDIDRHPCAKASLQYAMEAGNWFGGNREIVRGKQEELARQIEHGLTGVDPVAEASRIKDAVEVISWYKFQIHVKIKRALSGLQRYALDAMDACEHDARGSAKVALIGMDRSIGAWGILYRAFENDKDRILDMLVHLDRLRRSTESAFPTARAFVRPGFDTDGR